MYNLNSLINSVKIIWTICNLPDFLKIFTVNEQIVCLY